jgi:hypothetical protein
MKKIRRQNAKNRNFCAKCADVEKQATKLCKINNNMMVSKGCSRNEDIQNWVIIIYHPIFESLSRGKRAEILHKITLFC